MKNIFLTFLFAISILTINVKAQISLELGAFYAPTYAKMSSDFFQNKLFHSGGIRLNSIIGKSIIFRTGLVYRKLGANFILEPSAWVPFRHQVSYITSSIDVPINFGFYFNSNDLRLGPIIGINNSFLLKQEGDSFRGRNELGIYRPYALTLQLGMDFRIELSEKVNLSITPFWLNQLNKNDSPYKQRAFGSELGVNFKI